MHWKFWIGLGGILISIGFAIGFTIAQLLYAQGAGITIAGITVSIAPVAGAGVASLGLFQAWNKSRKEEERIPAITFDGFVRTSGTITLPLDRGQRS